MTFSLSRLIPIVAAVVLAQTAAQAQPYPAKPVRVISSSAAGGLSDVFMRVVGDHLSKRWGQPVIVVNRPGGNFNISARACAEATPDGYTFCLLPNEAVTYNRYMFKSLPFDPEAIVPVTNLFFIVQALAATSELKAKTVSELIKLVKARPKTYSYSTANMALILFVESLNRDHGTDLVRVPFRGGGDAVNGMLTGATPITFLGLANMMPHLESGRITPFVVDSDQRSPILPDVPTVREHGYDGPMTRSYFGLFAPSGTPPDMIHKVAQDIREIVSDAAFAKQHMVSRGLEPVANTPEAFAAFLRKDTVDAKRVLDAAGVQPQ